MQTEHITIFITCSTLDEARHIAKLLVHERLAACANILNNAISVYQWQDRVIEESEIVLIVKTRAVLFDKVSARVHALHSYDLPCIVAWPIVQGDTQYCEWLSAQTRENGDS